MARLTDIINRIKKSGKHRIVNSSKDKVNIEIEENGKWVIVTNNVTQTMAEDIIRQSSNKVLLG